MPMVFIVEGGAGGCFNDTNYHRKPSFSPCNWKRGAFGQLRSETAAIHVRRILSADSSTRTLNVFGYPSNWNLEATYHHISLGFQELSVASDATTLAKRDAPNYKLVTGFNYDSSTQSATEDLPIFDITGSKGPASYEISLDCANCGSSSFRTVFARLLGLFGCQAMCMALSLLRSKLGADWEMMSLTS